MTETNRNYTLDLIKLIGIIIIILHHSGLFKNILYRGYILVEMFFMISGYLLVSTYEKYPHVSVKQHILKRLKKLYPDYFVAWGIFFVASYIVLKTFPCSHWFEMISELLLIQNWYKIGGLNYPAWYISVMILSEIIIYAILKLTNVKVFRFFAVVVATLIYIRMFLLKPFVIENWGVYHKIFYMPFWRGFAAMLLGVLIFYISAKIKPSSVIKYNIIYTIMICAFLLTLFLPYKVDYLSIILIFMVILLSTCKCSWLNSLGNTCICKFFYKYQYSLFLNHACMLSVFRYIEPYLPIQNIIFKLLIILLFVFVGAYIQKSIVIIITHICSKRSCLDGN